MILVTGWDGYIGSKLMPKLKNARGFKGDIRDYKNCLKQVKGAKVVLHMAGILDEKSPDLFSVNVKGAENIVRACRECKVKKLVYLSTVGVSALAKVPINEKSEYKPETPYERSKQMAEICVRNFKKSVILRSALVMGDNKFWLNIVKSCRGPLISSGNFSWQTIYVDDLVSGIIYFLRKKEALGKTIVLANNEKVKLWDIYSCVRKELGLGKGWSIPVFLGYAYAYLEGFKEKPKIIPEHISRLVRTRKYDLRLASRLGWKAKIGYKEGVQLMIKEFRKNKLIRK